MSIFGNPARSVTRVARWLCGAAGGLGAVVLAGYASGSSPLVTVVPGHPPMVANTALALVLLALAGMLRCRPELRGLQRFVAMFAAVGAVAIGAGTLVEHVAGVELGIDRILVDASDRARPARPPPMTALAVLLVGSALLVFDTRRSARARPSEWLLLAAGHTALVGLMGQIFSGPHAYPGAGPVLGVALPAALGFTGLVVGLLLARSDTGLMRVATSLGPGGIMFRRLVLPFVFAPAMIGLAVKSSLGHASLHDPALLVATLFAGTGMFGVLVLPLFATPLDRAHRALEDSQARLEGIIGIASDAIISIDEQQHITIFNRGAEHTFGWTAAEILGKPLELLIPTRLRALHRASIQRFATEATDARRMGERARAIVGLRKDDSEFPAEAAISKLRIGDEVTFTIVLRDMTHHANLEQELRKAVAGRDEVLGIVAHDLRNPLSTAMLTAELLVRPEHERRVESRRLADRLNRALGRATRLIEDLLDVTRLEHGSGFSIDPRPQAIPALAREAFDMLEAAATAASVSLEAKFPPDLPKAWADEARIVQVLGNLIGNAVKFTPHGGLVRVLAVRHGDELRVTVADTGQGIAAEHLDHMFDRFWQGSAGDHRGAGLGLAIVKGIVEAHGGRIWAESEPGRGCRITFTLPVATVMAHPAEAATMQP